MEVDDGLAGLDATYFFARAAGHIGAIWRDAPFSSAAPTRAELDAPSVEPLDIRSGASGIDFRLPSEGTKTTYRVEMRDGVGLATDVYLPSTGDGPWPTVVYRTPYNKNTDHPSRLTNNGYAVVAQDVRGRYGSEGMTQVFLCDGWGDLQDGYDTVLWILDQPWCDGGVGSVGGSARGDANADGSVDISDPIGLLGHLFTGGIPPTCEDAADANDDAQLDISDAVFLLGYLFLDGGVLDAECGPDPTPDLLECVTYPACPDEPF